jgi:hypothetical protein
MANNESDLEQSRAIHSDDEFVKIRELVMQHKVCWEVWPEYHIDRDGKKVQIGFELELLGTHYHPEQSPVPGCAECVKVYEDLQQLAQWVIPQEQRDSRYKTGIFDASIHYSPRRQFRKDIILAIKILHREGFDRPTDDCEVECLNEMEKKLKELEAQKINWRG